MYFVMLPNTFRPLQSSSTDETGCQPRRRRWRRQYPRKLCRGLADLGDHSFSQPEIPATSIFQQALRSN
jgi:hypothetical protein